MNITNPEGTNDEIASLKWCAECNADAMSALFREVSVYWTYKSRPPWQHENVKG